MTLYRVFVVTKYYEATRFILSILNGLRNEDALLDLLCSFVFFDRSVKMLRCLKTYLWLPETCTQQIVGLSSAQLSLAMKLKQNSKKLSTNFFFTFHNYLKKSNVECS